MTSAITVLPEPELEFRYGQRLCDPHAGLALFGPFDADLPSHLASISYGVIGTSEGMSAFQKWTALMLGPIVTPAVADSREDPKARYLWPAYPGFRAAFDSTWYEIPAWSHVLDSPELLHAASHKDANKRAYDVVNLYHNAIRIAHERDEQLNVIVCVVPDQVWMNCRPLSKVSDGHGRSLSRAERRIRQQQPDLFGYYDPEEYKLSVDFRRQLKARAMEFGVPLQLIRESTLRIGPALRYGDRGLTCESDRAWNLSTALYYKAGGKPWRLSTARDGVCYIGIAFRRTEDRQRPNTACCAAQMFLDTGDGIVFRGEYGPWYSPEKRQCHLDTESARRLLAGVLKTYEEQGGVSLREVFLHSRSTINEGEFSGYQQACPPGVKLVGVRVRTDLGGPRMFRQGQWPILRGTVWKLGPRTAYLWASGFKPSLLTYDGWEVPVPLRIDVQYGDADIEQVARDIFGLTKLNYNACKLGDSLPVTVGFSDAVGEILVSNPTVSRVSPSFKFYI